MWQNSPSFIQNKEKSENVSEFKFDGFRRLFLGDHIM